MKFESKAADMGLTGEFAVQFLSSHGYLLNELRELQNNYEDIKVSYQLASASPMRSLVNNKFHEVSSKGHHKLLPRRSTHIKPTHNTSTYSKSTKQQHKRPKSVWEFMGLRG